MIDPRFAKSSLGERAGSKTTQNEDYQYEKLPGYNFMTGIVSDVISNPYEYLNRKYKTSDFLLKDVLSGRIRSENLPKVNGRSPDNPSTTFRVGHKDLIDTMPINSIFAYIVDGYEIKDNPKIAVCYPFFPGHLSLPLKTGEYVWLLEEKIGNVSYYYWVCRKVGHLQLDDLNYTNLERTPAVTSLLNNANNSKGNIGVDPAEVFSNEGNASINNSTIGKRSNLPLVMSELLRRSYSHDAEFTGEPVPRLSKKCGDVLIQGSNNAGMHITTEKFTDLTNKASIFYTGKENPAPPNRTPNSSAIDIFVSRKKSSVDALANLPGGLTTLSFNDNNSKLKAHPNTTQAQYHDYVENNKVADIMTKDIEKRKEMYSKELNDFVDDATDVGARLYMSRDCAIDNIFGSSFDVLSAYQGPSIVSYAQHNRMIGLSDARLVSKSGQSFIDLDPAGNIVAKASKDDGQQFLSLGVGGTTRLQGKDRIEISQSGGSATQITIANNDVTVDGKFITIDGSENITLTAGEPNTNPKVTTIFATQEGGIQAISVGGEGGAVLSVKPIQQFLELYTNSLPQAKANMLLPLGAAAVPVGLILESGLVEAVIEALATKYFFAE